MRTYFAAPRLSAPLILLGCFVCSAAAQAQTGLSTVAYDCQTIPGQLHSYHLLRTGVATNDAGQVAYMDDNSVFRLAENATAPAILARRGQWLNYKQSQLRLSSPRHKVRLGPQGLALFETALVGPETELSCFSITSCGDHGSGCGGTVDLQYGIGAAGAGPAQLRWLRDPGSPFEGLDFEVLRSQGILALVDRIGSGTQLKPFLLLIPSPGSAHLYVDAGVFGSQGTPGEPAPEPGYGNFYGLGGLTSGDLVPTAFAARISDSAGSGPGQGGGSAGGTAGGTTMQAISSKLFMQVIECGSVGFPGGTSLQVGASLTISPDDGCVTCGPSFPAARSVLWVGDLGTCEAAGGDQVLVESNMDQGTSTVLLRTNVFYPGLGDLCIKRIATPGTLPGGLEVQGELSASRLDPLFAPTTGTQIAGVVVFHAMLSEGPENPAGFPALLACTGPGQVHLLVSHGMPMPHNPGRSFTHFGNPVVNPRGQVYFWARADGPNQAGIFRADLASLIGAP